MITINDTFFTVNGRVTDENRLKKEIYNRIKPYVTNGIAKRVTGLLDVMRMECCAASLPLYQDRIHVKNGTYYLDGTFSEKKDFCRNRLSVDYNPSDESALKIVTLGILEASKKWTMPIKNWALALSFFALNHPEIMSHISSK